MANKSFNDIENDAANFLTFIQGLWFNHFFYILILFIYGFSTCFSAQDMLRNC